MFYNRTFKHIDITYIYNRIRVILDEVINPESPWLTKEAVALLTQLIRPSDIGVEFGSGRSTKWFAKRLAKLTSIESSREWFDKVNSNIKTEGLVDKVTYIYIENEEEYAKFALNLPDGSVDFCLIDGDVRDQCALNMVDKMRVGGILVIDNVNWYIPNNETISPDSRRTVDGFESECWYDFSLRTQEWRRLWTSNGVTDTAIFIKI